MKNKYKEKIKDKDISNINNNKEKEKSQEKILNHQKNILSYNINEFLNNKKKEHVFLQNKSI